ncbi:hypothetical protein LCGC14_0582380 [marine sediment metagenome]|uniref:RCK C-terminal domain-containing protein n=1 Tax=marine sediment metagenome TaxID=412755 RepID=A0A0F9U277_9ZZZZ|nr:hypothetical protein [Methylophaga sp.]HEC58361.1 hypothetical protein [Methylophaga sp.]
MSSIYFLVPTLIAIIISMLIVRAGAIALMMTGMSFDQAKFQALSAFSGTGFTTREAERVVKHAQRRKIITWLMILGNAGIVTMIVTATSSFANTKGLEVGVNALFLMFGIWLIYFIAKHSTLTRYWEVFARKHLARLKLFDEDAAVDEMLHITEGYGVVRIQLLENSIFIGKPLAELNVGLLKSFILGIERGNEWHPVPRSDMKPKIGDFLVIYGQLDDLADHFS